MGRGEVRATLGTHREPGPLSDAPAVTTEPHAAGPGLVRAVGRGAMIALGINAIVGAGIFGLPSRVDALVGPYAPLAYFACAALVACITLCFAEVSSRFTETGGPALYADRALGPVVGFLSGWLLWLARVAALATIVGVFVDYLAHFWPAAATPAGRAAAITTVVAALTIVNVVGVRQAAGVLVGLTIAKLAPLAIFVVVGLVAVGGRGIELGAALAPSPEAFGRAMLQLVFAFAGFEALTIAAGEMKDPRRDLPLAMTVALVVSTALYVAIQIACRGALGAELALSTKPLADAALVFLGPTGAALIALGALVSTAGTMGGTLLTGPRILYALGEQGRLPPWFAKTHARFRTPHANIVLTSALGWALALSGTFTYLVGLSVLTRIASYLTTAIALLVFRARRESPDAHVRVPAGPVLAWISIVACVAMAWRSEARELRDVALACAAGLVLYGGFWFARKNKARG